MATACSAPTAITGLNDHSGRLLITEKQGMIQAFWPDTALLDTQDR